MPAPTSNRHLPPGPRMPKPVAGYVVLLNHIPTLKRLKRRYGDAFTVNLPVYGRTTIVSKPEYVKQMFTSKPGMLTFGEDNPLGDVLGPGSMFALEGAPHMRERKLLLPPFHGERMKSYESIIEEEALRQMARWRPGEEFETLPSFLHITLHAILRAVFGAEGQHERALAARLPRLVKLGSPLTLVPWLAKDLGPLSPGGRFKRERRAYDQIINAMIDEALADPQLDERSDVMALLLRTKYDDGEAMSRSAIADELLTLLAAGHETTATSLAWAVERLRRNPEVLARLQEEARSDGKALRTATVHEVQRTRPVITTIDRRVAVDEFELGEWRIPKGDRLFACATLIHDDERFFERPHEFDPDRFVGRTPDTYTWIPFGGGTRRCIGAAFAQMEMNIVLRTLLRDFDLVPTSEPDEKWRARGVAFAPAKGGRAVVRRVGRRAATSKAAGATAQVAA